MGPGDLSPVFSELRFGCGWPSTGSTQSLSFTNSSSIPLGGISVLTEGAANLDYTVTGGTCSIGSTSNCTVQVQFLTTVVGARLGAVVLTDQNTPPNTLITVPLSGTGSGPMVAFGPGTITTFVAWPELA